MSSMRLRMNPKHTGKVPKILQSPFMAAANLLANAAGIFEDRINAQLKLHPELSVDSKVRREQWAKDHGINLTM